MNFYFLWIHIALTFYYIQDIQNLCWKKCRHRTKRIIQTVAGGFWEQFYHYLLLVPGLVTLKVVIAARATVWLFLCTFTASTQWKGHTASSLQSLLSICIYREKGLPDRGCATQQRAVSRPIINQQLFKSTGDSSCTFCGWQVGEQVRCEI